MILYSLGNRKNNHYLQVCDGLMKINIDITTAKVTRVLRVLQVQVKEITFFFLGVNVSVLIQKLFYSNLLLTSRYKH